MEETRNAHCIWVTNYIFPWREILHDADRALASIDMTVNEKYEARFYAYESRSFLLSQMTRINEENRPCSHRGKFSMKGSLVR